MADALVIIEAPGKRAALSDVLWQAGVRDCEVLATVGHIAANPNGLRPIQITSSFRETAYAIREDRREVAARIREAAQDAARIYLATDDDQEGDVIARDVLYMVIAPEDRVRVRRVRLRSLSPSEVTAALDGAAPFDPLAAAKGDARRILDRLIGALSSAEGAVGRVQGSLLLALAQQKPVLGVMTYLASAEDGGADWVAQAPVYADTPMLDAERFDVRMAAASSRETTLASRPLNYGEIVLSASLEADARPREVARAMQSLYERGQLTYPRSTAQALSPESARRLEIMAQMNGADFDARRFAAVRSGAPEVEHGHEAPNPAGFDVPLNRQNALLTLEEQTLVHVARHLVDCGLRCRVEQPSLGAMERLPEALTGLPWHRRTEIGQRFYEAVPPAVGMRAWTAEQSLLQLMNKNRLGRPSTLVEHVDKFASRGLVDEGLELTAKGRAWCANVGQLFGQQNVARLVEEYLDVHRESAPLMVADMVSKFGIALGEASGVPLEQELDDEQTNTVSSV